VLTATLLEDDGDTNREDETECFVLIVGDAVVSPGASKKRRPVCFSSSRARDDEAGGARRRPRVRSTATPHGSSTRPNRRTYVAIA
jgi:hypothetical protein